MLVGAGMVACGGVSTHNSMKNGLRRPAPKHKIEMYNVFEFPFSRSNKSFPECHGAKTYFEPIASDMLSENVYASVCRK